jgi:hypothetical protein
MLKCKSKPQWDTTLYLLRRVYLKSQALGKYIEKLESLNIADRNEKSYTIAAEKFGSSSVLNMELTIWPSNSTHRYIFRISENKGFNRYLYANIHWSIICSSQKVETIQVFINTRADKQNVAYTYNRIFFCHKKKWIMSKDWGNDSSGRAIA